MSETRFAAVTVAEVDVSGSIDLELLALDWPYTTWPPRSGFAPAHQAYFEARIGEQFARGASPFELRLQLAVVDGAPRL